MNNESTIRFLAELPDQACVLIFTRADAEQMVPEGHKITDEEWVEIVNDFSDCYPDDEDWENFGNIVNRNINRENA